MLSWIEQSNTVLHTSQRMGCLLVWNFLGKSEQIIPCTVVCRHTGNLQLLFSALVGLLVLSAQQGSRPEPCMKLPCSSCFGGVY